MSDIDWTDNSEIIRAHLAGEDPDLAIFSYLEENVCSECGAAVKDMNEHLSCFDSQLSRTGGEL